MTEMTEKNSIEKSMNERSCYLDEVPPMKLAPGYEAYDKKNQEGVGWQWKDCMALVTGRGERGDDCAGVVGTGVKIRQESFQIYILTFLNRMHQPRRAVRPSVTLPDRGRGRPRIIGCLCWSSMRCGWQKSSVVDSN